MAALTTFHWRDNLYFTRLNGGAVRVRKFSQPLLCGKPWPLDEDTGDVFDVTIPGAEWVSIIASVSGQDVPAGDAYRLAEDLHLWAGGDV